MEVRTKGLSFVKRDGNSGHCLSSDSHTGKDKKEPSGFQRGDERGFSALKRDCKELLP